MKHPFTPAGGTRMIEELMKARVALVNRLDEATKDLERIHVLHILTSHFSINVLKHLVMEQERDNDT